MFIIILFSIHKYLGVDEVAAENEVASENAVESESEVATGSKVASEIEVVPETEADPVKGKKEEIARRIEKAGVARFARNQGKEIPAIDEGAVIKIVPEDPRSAADEGTIRTRRSRDGDCLRRI